MSAENQQMLLWGIVKAHVKPRVPLLSFEEFLTRRVQQTQAQPSLFDYQQHEVRPVAVTQKVRRPAVVSDSPLLLSYEKWRARKTQAFLKSIAPGRARTKENRGGPRRPKSS